MWRYSSASLTDVTAWGLAERVLMSRRYVRPPLSPDRNYNETIIDMQNTFVWEKKHIFRPHQHFTYDPASWSRPLAEKVKKERRLSLLERLSALKERADEARPAEEGVPQEEVRAPISTAPHGGAAGPDMVAADAPGEAAKSGASPSSGSTTLSRRLLASTPLQELLDEALLLSKTLSMPRTSRKMGLRQQEKLRAQYHLVLRQLFNRIQCAVMDETVTLNALIYTWFMLIHKVSELIPALIHASADEDGLEEEWALRSEEAAIRAVFDALMRTLLAHVVSTDAIATRWGQEQPSLEEVIELMVVLLHPFTRNGLRTWHAAALQGSLEEALLWGYDLLQSVLVKRITATEATSEGSWENDSSVADRAGSSRVEWLDSFHLWALLDVAKRINTLTSVKADLPRYCIMVKTQAQHLLSLLQSAIPGLFGWRQWQHTLADLDKAQSATSANSEHGGTAARSSRNPKAVALDPTTPPRGPQRPPTQADDVHYCTEAFTRLLELSLGLGLGLGDGLLGGATTAMLRLLSHAPNYDLDAACVASLGVRLAGLAEADGGAERPLRAMLLLSRVDFARGGDRAALGELALRLCRAEAPREASERQALDWRRLRGVALGRLLDVLWPADLDAAARALGDGGAWEEHLAFGTFDGLVPVELWRAACEARFPDASPWVSPVATIRGGGAAGGCPRGVALALLVLRGRLGLERRQSRRVPFDATSLGYVAACVEALTAGRASKEQLARLPDIWDQCASDMGEWGEQVLPLLSEAKTYVVMHRNVEPNKVLTF